ncbi:hypothetical protein [Streptomyces sp. NPDC046862]|uniref:hypothetical protein n=1 Tax=Streptomyces sp. NPDC046862 TaxID=3154603 RepID=UPI003453C35F
MSADTAPAAVPDPNQPPTAAPNSAHTGAQDGPQAGLFASMAAPVQPARSAAFTLNPTTAQTGTGAEDAAVNGASSDAFQGDHTPDNTSGKNTVGTRQQQSVVRTWLLAAAKRWEKGADARNKALDLKKARAQAVQVKESRQVTVNRSGGFLGNSPSGKGSGGSGGGGKSLNSKSGSGGGSKGPKSSSGSRNNSADGSGRGTGSGGGAGRGPSSSGGGRGGHGPGSNRSSGGKDHSSSPSKSSKDHGGGSGKNSKADSGKSSSGGSKDSSSGSGASSGSGKPGGGKSSGGSSGTSGSSGAKGSADGTGKNNTGPSSNSGASTGKEPGSKSSGSSDQASPKGTSSTGSGNSATGSKGSPTSTGAGCLVTPEEAKQLRKNKNAKDSKADKPKDTDDTSQPKKTDPAARQPGSDGVPVSTQESREAGYRDGVRAGTAVAHVQAYKDGVKDGYRDRKEIADQEKARLDKAHADHKQQQPTPSPVIPPKPNHPPKPTNPPTIPDPRTEDSKNQPSNTEQTPSRDKPAAARTGTEPKQDRTPTPKGQPMPQASSADHQPTAPGKRTTSNATPIQVKNVGASYVELGAGADRERISQGEVRTLKAFERRFAAKADTMVRAIEAARAMKAQAEDQIKRVIWWVEQAKTVEGGDDLVSALTKLEEAAQVQVGTAEEIMRRAARSADACQALLANVETRYGSIYKAVVDSKNTAPAVVSYYREMANA